MFKLTVLVFIGLLAIGTYSGGEAAPSSLSGKVLSAHNQALGFCKSADNFVDLADILFIKNMSVKQNSEKGFSVIRIENGQTLVIDQYTNNKNSPDISHVFDIGLFVEKKYDIDVQLSFILLNQKVALFWRETYQNKSYRQGIIKIENEKLFNVCEGTGGIDSND